MKRIEIKVGDRFGRLVVIEPPYSYRSPSGQMKRKVRCKCDCGNVKDFYLDLLRRGHTTSCGCFSREDGKVRLVTHGASYTKLYSVRRTMIQRCTNVNSESYCRYGGRGIKVCEEWLDSFEAFRKWAYENGYKEGLTIDRIDNNGDYEPSNCRLVSMKVQSNNRSDNIHYELNGVTHTLSEWCDIYSVNYDLVKQRMISLNWPFRKALLTPKKK